MYVAINCSMSIDGKLALPDNSYEPFGSAEDRQLMYALRSRFDAVMCGAATVRETNASLERTTGGPPALRIVVSGSASLSPESPVFLSRASSPLVVITSNRAADERVAEYLERGAHVERFPWPISFAEVLRRLERGYGVRRLLCEGGGKLNAALLEEQLVDYLYVTLCPLVIGGAATTTFSEGQGAGTLAQAEYFRLERCLRRGEELFLEYSRRARRASST